MSVELQRRQGLSISLSVSCEEKGLQGKESPWERQRERLIRNKPHAVIGKNVREKIRRDTDQERH